VSASSILVGERRRKYPEGPGQVGSHARLANWSKKGARRAKHRRSLVGAQSEAIRSCGSLVDAACVAVVKARTFVPFEKDEPTRFARGDCWELGRRLRADSRMRMTGEQVLAALAEWTRGIPGLPDSEALDTGLRAVRRRMQEDRARRRSMIRWSWAASLAAAIVLAGELLYSGHPSRHATAAAISFRVEGGDLVEGGYLRESGRDGVRLLFEEGTEFIFMPGTRGRLRAVDATGARVAIEHGTASFQVVPSAVHRWQIDVGPFLVTVKGTAFTVSWDATTEKFVLKLRQGRVTVSGPVTGGEIELRAGQRLLIDLPRGETVINEARPDAPVESPGAPTGATSARPAERRSSAGAGPGMRTPAVTPPATRLDGDRGWAHELAVGHLDSILAEVERAGLKATLETASSEDLVALADAARYRRRMDLAREALLAERRRFPESPRSLDVPFLLGRVEEADERGFERAIEWYDVYLAGEPTGTYAPEALGRKMTLLSKLGGVPAARPIAQEYLRRFPGGTYAGPARAFAPPP
jgi:hypothetical protein